MQALSAPLATAHRTSYSPDPSTGFLPFSALRDGNDALFQRYLGYFLAQLLECPREKFLPRTKCELLFFQFLASISDPLTMYYCEQCGSIFSITSLWLLERCNLVSLVQTGGRSLGLSSQCKCSSPITTKLALIYLCLSCIGVPRSGHAVLDVV